MRSLLNQVDDIVQIGGSTNPGDGINTAMGVLNAEGSLFTKQIICLSTDGLPNAGASVETALNNAQNSPVGLEQFSVIAIEDPESSTTEADFHSFYDPLVFGVFGDGAVTVARDVAEYANIFGAACLLPELELIGLEFNQAIQDWSDSVQLIEDKVTYVRAHIQLQAEVTVPEVEVPAVAVARLRGFRGGTEFPESPLSPVNPKEFIVPLHSADPQEIIDQRGKLDSSLNFQLPASWLNGTVELRVEGVGRILDCQDTADTPNDCSVQVTFNPTAHPKVKFIHVKWVDDAGIPHQSTEADITMLERSLLAIYPIDGLDLFKSEVRQYPRKIGTAMGTTALIHITKLLEHMRFRDCQSTPDCPIYFGVIGDVPNARPQGVVGRFKM